MDQVGLVRKVSNGEAEVEVRRISGCGENCKGCGGGCNVPSHVVVLSNDINAKVGDFVEIKGETKNILKYTMIIYMVPFVFLIMGISLGMKFLKNMSISSYEPLSFLIGLIFLAFGYLVVKFIDKKVGKKEENIIKMTRII
ncbi:SoxR reducing system RseC family protein [Tissierella sp. MB52-C2]|uniref:SoxR reducing system RseC family protein n=1 Tax=Tissierella sp. MB52-C2 TaxID=3070999 RepID=UPI00280BC3B8|nr:SoxR reducing system RseC family protein [Tissierella sp. MB52-C2]WMM26824.1 SoxR reducing system RseC family protein [Tissierella sp. MB52-C2]